MSDLGPGAPDGADRFEVGRRLGSGGMGAVFVATDTRFDRLVALKVMSSHLASAPEFRARFRREADVLARLDSPHVTTIYDHGEDDGTLWIATQLVRGGDLGNLLHEQGALSPLRAVQVCGQVAEALVATHAVGVLHRDVKPGNVLLRDPEAESLHAYLCDFGVADTGADRLTVAGGVTGTWQYLAPERGQGAPAAPTTDVYAVGCLLWACLTGLPPYAGSDVDIAIGHLEGSIPQVPETGPGLAGLNLVLLRTLAKNPAERFRDATELRDALAELARELPATGGPLSLREPSTTRGEQMTGGGPRRRRLILGAGVVAALLVAGVVAVVLPDGDPATGPAMSSNRAARQIAVTSDFTGDGLGDLAVQDSESRAQSIQVLTGDGRSFAAGKPSVSRQFDVIRGDIDGNGTEELVSLESGTDPADGSTDFPGSVATVTPYALDGTPLTTYALEAAGDSRPEFVGHEMLADLTGDGRDDVVLAPPTYDDGEDFEVWLAESNGDGFEPLRKVYSGTSSARRILAADVDGDGDDDLVLAGPDSDLAVLQAGSEPLVPTEVESVNSNTDAAFVADVDGDGADELVSVDPIGASNSVVVIQRTDDQWNAQVWYADLDNAVGLNEGSLSTGVSDVNGDGLDDLVRFSDAPAGKPREVRVLVSSGTDFAAPAPWGTFVCRCKRFFNPVQRQRPY
ncbi:protein kinase domain-containing protein [Nocardioides jensenii]|uniref:protein kinase domain-containing protein n=1 Tax=Nocardioides jensenii TaxID=1843 RepID=UPI000830B086|nr:protein kinase [Nocardioides jensenii]